MLNKINKLRRLHKKIRLLNSPRNKIQLLQWRKLKAIIAHAYATVPYYHDLFSRQGLKPEDINSFSDLKKIPPTSKHDIVALDQSRITSDAFSPAEMEEMQTSGSTGEPFKFFRNKTYNEQVGLDGLRSKFIHGMKPTDRILRIGGVETMVETPKNPVKRLFLPKATLSSFTTPQDILECYKRFRPNIIRGFISNLYEFALWLEENGLPLSHTPRFILCSAEMAHDFMQQKVAAVFRCRVIDRYATAELGVVADTCDRGSGYHVFEDSVFPEFIKTDGITYFVGTNLDNYATPFIRYHTFDACEPWTEAHSRCTCGLNTLKFKHIAGRDNDFIRKPDGQLLNPIAPIFLMRKYYHAITKYRLLQQDRRTLQLEIVPNESFSHTMATTLSEDLKVLTGGLQVDIQIVDLIPLEKSGKRRIIKSNVTGKAKHAN